MDILAPFALLGLGCGSCFVTLQIAAFAGISDEQAGIGAGLITPARRWAERSASPSSRSSPTTASPRIWPPAGGDTVLIRAAQAAANHEAFLISAGVDFVALLMAALLLPRRRSRRPLGQG